MSEHIGGIIISGIIVGSALACWIILWYRNNQVAKYRSQLAGKISDAVLVDIAAGRPWEWRYEELERVPYDRMVLSFRPLASFYPDLSFTQISFANEAGEDHHGL